MKFLLLLIALSLTSAGAFSQPQSTDRILDSVMVALDKSAASTHPLAIARQSLVRGDSAMAEGVLFQLVNDSTQSPATISAGGALLTKIYRNKPLREQEYIIALSKAAAADLEMGNHASASLIELVVYLKKKGDNRIADKYADIIGNAINDDLADDELGILLPEIREVHDDIVKQARNKRIANYIVLAILATAACAATLAWRRARRRERERYEANVSLNSSVVTRDEYIRQLLEICSSYQEASTAFSKTVARKIKANQSADLLESIESGKVRREHTAMFLSAFDSMVHKLFPGFIAELNSLLKPEERLELKEGQPLTTELRIVAFMKLGVTDTDRLASFLDVSRNTIYSYRNRMRSRAINRDTFESDICVVTPQSIPEPTPEDKGDEGRE